LYFVRKAGAGGKASKKRQFLVIDLPQQSPTPQHTRATFEME